MDYPSLREYLATAHSDSLSEAVLYETFGPTRDQTLQGHGVFIYKDLTYDPSGREKRVALSTFYPSVFGEIEKVFSAVSLDLIVLCWSDESSRRA